MIVVVVFAVMSNIKNYVRVNMGFHNLFLRIYIDYDYVLWWSVNLIYEACYCFSFILGTVHMQQYKWRVVAKTKLTTKSCTATATIFRHGRHESGYVIIYKYGHACWRWALKMKMCTWCFSNGVFDTLISTAARTDEQKFFLHIYI